MKSYSHMKEVNSKLL